MPFICGHCLAFMRIPSQLFKHAHPLGPEHCTRVWGSCPASDHNPGIHPGPFSPHISCTDSLALTFVFLSQVGIYSCMSFKMLNLSFLAGCHSPRGEIETHSGIPLQPLTVPWSWPSFYKCLLNIYIPALLLPLFLSSSTLIESLIHFG